MKFFRSILYVLGSLCIIVWPNVSSACDACGSNLSIINPDLMVFNRTHTVSLNSYANIYSVSLFETEGSHHAASIPYINTRPHVHNPETGEMGVWLNYSERIFTQEVRARFFPIQNLSVTASVNLVHRKLLLEGEVLERQTGFGDMLISAQYHVINRLQRGAGSFRQRLSLGAGIKLPTGAYMQDGYDGQLEPHRQIGTGSTDFVFDVQWLMMAENFGWDIYAGYKANTANSINFKFGNTTTLRAVAFYSVPFSRSALTPTAGVIFEHTGEASVNNFGGYWKASGGKVLLAQAGLDYFMNNIGINLSAQLPVYEELNGEQFSNTIRVSAGLRYVFN